jgi:preprotein translocase subunit YajC
MPNLSTPILIALMVIAFYLLIMRPQKKRQQAIQQTLNSLGPGSRVLLGSGVFGTVIAIGERQALLEISPGVELTVLKQAIVRAVTEADEDDLTEEELPDDELVAEPEASVPQEIDYSRSSDSSGSTTGVDSSVPDGTTPSAGADPKRLG